MPLHSGEKTYFCLINKSDNFMKKNIGLFLIMLMAISCNDGDMVFESLNFDEVPMQKCEDKELYFKVSDKEMLVVNLSSPTGEPIINNNLQVGEELEILTNNTNQIIYRLYDNSISNQNMLCSDVPPAFPQVVDEYISENNGSIVVTKQLQVRNNDNQPNSFSVAYNFSFLFKNIVLSQSESQIKYPNYVFGTYQAESYTLNFNQFDRDEINSCGNLSFYMETSDKVMQLQLTENLPTTIQETNLLLSDNQYIKIKINQGILSQIEGYSPCDFGNDTLFFDVWTSTAGNLKINAREVEIAGVPQLVYDFEIEQATFTNYDRTIQISNLPIGSYTE